MLKLMSYADQEEPPSQYYSTDPGRYQIQDIYPATHAEIPEHLPEEIGDLYRQGSDNVPANPDAAGIMFRKTIEATLRDKCPDATGSLFGRIDQALALGVLTEDLARYAHTIRLEGNEAAHGAYDEEDAKSLHKFVRLVLQYVYSLPGMREEIDAKARAQAETVNNDQSED